ncbi:MAG: GAF domain-containing protein [Elusimicrobia bacterium]|nr:GAF domain-containing protein [Elusimicrobiota bacterium]
MSDSRLPSYREAARAMVRGRFDLPIPVGERDAVGELGAALSELAHGLERRFERQFRLTRLTESITSGLMLEEVLENLYVSFKGVIPYDRIGFALLEDDGRTLRAHWAKSEASEVFLKVGYAAPMQGSSLERVLETGRPRILNDLPAYLAEHPASQSTALVVEEGVQSSLTCPVVSKGRAVGFLFFSSRFPNTYADEHVDVFLQVAATVAALLEKSRLYGRLVALDRTKNAFLGMAAHDLRGPIGNMMNYAELLSLDLISDEKGRRAALADIRRIGESCLNMLETLLDVSAIESGHLRVEPRPTPVAPFLERTAHLCELLARKKSTAVEVRAAPSLPATFVMDPERMEQALSNLVSNAVKFSPPGSRVLVEAGAGASGGLVFSVRDQGPGIPESERQKLFKDFSRTSVRPTASEKSTGLGLAIVKRLVEAHRGVVEVECRPGEGTTFTVTLPPPP